MTDLMKRERKRERQRERELRQDTLKCRQGAASEDRVAHVSRCCHALRGSFPCFVPWAGESHFDDCQCDFNTISQLDANCARGLCPSWGVACPCVCVSRATWRATSGREISDTQKGLRSQCWHLWIKLRFALMFYWKRPWTCLGQL